MIYYKTDDEIALLKESCLLVSKVLGYVATIIKPGITGILLDQKAEEYIRDHGGIPGFKGYQGFTATLCISINEAVVHGIPSHYEFRDTDIVSVDCGVIQNSFYGDSAYTFIFPNVLEQTKNLCKTTNESLYKAIEVAKVGNRIGDIGFAVQSFCEKKGYSIVRELVGHGIGKNLHESPDVPNFGMKGKGVKLLDGMTIAIEPMVNLGVRNVIHDTDGWTIKTKDGKPSAHYEHTIAIRKEKTEILTDHSYINDSIKNNSNLFDF